MKLSDRKPEIYQKCHDKFGVEWDKGIIITYGDTVYTKNPALVSPDLVVHESTHIRQQQEMGPEAWWDLYLKDKKFRLSQELEAYRNQIAYIRKNYTRKTRRYLELKLASDMATLYGNMCTKEEALEMLK